MKRCRMRWWRGARSCWRQSLTTLTRSGSRRVLAQARREAGGQSGAQSRRAHDRDRIKARGELGATDADAARGSAAAGDWTGDCMDGSSRPQPERPHALSAHAGDHKGEPDEATVAFVFIPITVSSKMLGTHFQSVLDMPASKEARERARPRIGQLSTFGIRLAKKSHVEDVVAEFKASGYDVHKIATGQTVALDAMAGPKRKDNERGQSNSAVYQAAECKFGKSSITQRHREEGGAARTKVPVGDDVGWVQHIVTVHCGEAQGSTKVVRPGPVLTRDLELRRR